MMSSAIAEPCVGAGFDLPFPGAINVEMRQADVPSAQFPGLWQQGLIDGYAYQLFANTTGVLQEGQSPSAWSIVVDCQQSLCLREVTGSPPGLAWDVSQRLEYCLVPPAVTALLAPSEPVAALARPDEPLPDEPLPDKLPSEPAPAEPPPSELAPSVPLPSVPLPSVPAATIATAGVTEGSLVTEKAGQCVGPQNFVKAASVCRPASLSDADPIVTLQRLLVMAGADPGLIDGVYGRNTQQAVLEVLGFAGRNLEVPEAIAAVDAYLCRQNQ